MRSMFVEWCLQQNAKSLTSIHAQLELDHDVVFSMTPENWNRKGMFRQHLRQYTVIAMSHERCGADTWEHSHP